MTTGRVRRTPTPQPSKQPVSGFLQLDREIETLIAEVGIKMSAQEKAALEAKATDVVAIAAAEAAAEEEHRAIKARLTPQSERPAAAREATEDGDEGEESGAPDGVIALDTVRRHIEPWERQHNETPRAFAAFSLFLSLQPSERTVKNAMMRYYVPNIELTRESRAAWKASFKQRKTINDWSVKHRWIDRSAAWEDEQARRLRLEMEVARADMAKRHAAMAVMVQQKVVTALQALTGQNLTPEQIARLLDVSVKIERLARGESTETTKVQGDENNPLVIESPVAEIEGRITRIIERRREAASFTRHDEEAGDEVAV